MMLKRMSACSPMHSDDITISFLLCKFNYTSHHWVTVSHTQTMKVLRQEQYFWDKDSCPTKNTLSYWLCYDCAQNWGTVEPKYLKSQQSLDHADIASQQFRTYNNINIVTQTCRRNIVWNCHLMHYWLIVMDSMNCC